MTARAPHLRTALWALLLVLGAAATVHLAGGLTEDHNEAAEVAEPELLLPLTADAIQAVELVVRGELRRVERDPAGEWLHHRHRHADAGAHRHAAEPAESARIRQHLEMLARTRIERSIAAGPPSDRFGVAMPALIALVYGSGAAPALRLQIGDLTPDGFSRYVFVPERNAIVTIPDYQVANLLKLFEERGDGPA